MLIRDTLHGDVDLSPVETAVLDSAVMQRMRGIKQLGTAYLVYPGALHTRFEHSLGTSFVAHRLVDSIRRSGHVVDDDTETAIGVAALLHDVTHVPFGHTLEDERRLFPRHDKGDRFERILAGELGATLDDLGLRAAVVDLLDGRLPKSKQWASDVVSSTIDADLLDYLRRDSLYTGLGQTYDDRVFRYFAVGDGRLVLDMSKHGMTRPDAWSEIVQLLRMRYFLTERVYYHHTKVVAGAIISKAVELALATGTLAEADLLELSDWSLLGKLRSAAIPAIDRLLDRFERRRLLKRGYVLSARSLDATERARLVELYHSSLATRREAEDALAEAIQCPPHEVIVYCPALTVMKEASALALTVQGIVPMTDLDPAGSSEISALATRHAALWRMYVFVPPQHVERTAQVAADFFGHASEHQPA
jgi:HD superfamily phosphohydrolase